MLLIIGLLCVPWVFPGGRNATSLPGISTRSHVSRCMNRAYARAGKRHFYRVGAQFPRINFDAVATQTCSAARRRDAIRPVASTCFTETWYRTLRRAFTHERELDLKGKVSLAKGEPSAGLAHVVCAVVMEDHMDCLVPDTSPAGPRFGSAKAKGRSALRWGEPSSRLVGEARMPVTRHTVADYRRGRIRAAVSAAGGWHRHGRIVCDLERNRDLNYYWIEMPTRLNYGWNPILALRASVAVHSTAWNLPEMGESAAAGRRARQSASAETAWRRK